MWVQILWKSSISIWVLLKWAIWNACINLIPFFVIDVQYVMALNSVIACWFSTRLQELQFDVVDLVMNGGMCIRHF